MTSTKRTNKIISWLLCLAMVFTILPLSVFAAETPEASYQEVENGEWLNGTLADALENVYENGTVKLMKDLTANEEYTLQNVTLDMNGYDVSLVDFYNFDVYNTVNIVNNSNSESEISGDTYYVIVTNTDSNCVVENISLLSENFTVSIGLNATFEIKGTNASVKSNTVRPFVCKGKLKIENDVNLEFGEDDRLFQITDANEFTCVDLSERTDVEGVKFSDAGYKFELILPQNYIVKLSDDTLVSTDYLKTTGVEDTNVTITKCNHDTFNYTANENILTQSCICGHHSENVTLPVLDDMIYDGTEKNIEITKTNGWSGDLPSVQYSGNRCNVGTFTASVTVGDQTATADYTIDEKQLTADRISTITDQVYTGEAITPAIEVKDNDTALVLDSDYTVAYEENTNAGTAKVIVTLKGNYKGTIEKEFTILPKQIAKPTTDTTEFVYNGTEQTYAVAENDKYEVFGNTMTNAGSQDVTVALKDKTNFEWTDGTTDDVTFTFTIAQATPTAVDGSVTKATSIRKNNKLSASTITGGKYKGVDDAELEGTYAWREPDKDMTADGKEIVVFTPADTNYAPIEIEVDVDVTTSSSSGGGGSSVARYTVKFETDGGSNIASKTVTRNSKLAEPEAPTKDGYSFIGWFTDEELTTAYDFDSKIINGFTLYAKWAKHDDEEPVTAEWENPFTDINENDWFFEDVKFINKNEFMQGTSDTTFAPNINITRAMMVTVLWRMENEPVVNYLMTFEDVEAESWYTEAVRWAASEGIVKGHSETEFAPNDNITREQIAAIMHRYALYKEYDVSAGENTNILSYDDFDVISEYAIASMQYAVGSGLMKGKTESTLNPKDFATRAEIAAILHRFMKGNENTMAPTLLYQGHGSVRIETPEGKVIYVDPYAGEGYDLPSDLILVTHGHSDHNKIELIEKQNDDCVMITHEESNLDGELQSFDLGYVKVEAVEAENKNHNIKECVGYILTFSNGKQVYFTGDTSTTNQMSTLAERKIDYAFYCCDGKFNMDRAEAAECAELVGAKYNIPYHMAPGSNFDRAIAEEFDAPGRIILEDGQTLVIE